MESGWRASVAFRVFRGRRGLQQPSGSGGRREMADMSPSEPGGARQTAIRPSYRQGLTTAGRGSGRRLANGSCRSPLRETANAPERFTEYVLEQDPASQRAASYLVRWARDFLVREASAGPMALQGRRFRNERHRQGPLRPGVCRRTPAHAAPAGELRGGSDPIHAPCGTPQRLGQHAAPGAGGGLRVSECCEPQRRAIDTGEGLLKDSRTACERTRAGSRERSSRTAAPCDGGQQPVTGLTGRNCDRPDDHRAALQEPGRPWRRIRRPPPGRPW